MKPCFILAWLLLPAVSFAADPVATPAAVQPPQVHFARWRDGFAARAMARGFDAALVQRTLAGLKPDPRVLEHDRAQPEFTRTMADYLAGVVSPARISNGRDALKANAALMAVLQKGYPVPATTLAAIWGLESAYGHIQGDFDVVRSLATLADEGRRQKWAEGELLAVLTILASADARRDELKGAWAGAMGQPQFLPSAYLRYAVDQDSDGRKDIWTSPVDALASMAHFLAAHGWQASLPWGMEVQLPRGFAFDLADDTRLSIGAWSVKGVIRADHAIWSAAEQTHKARLIVPAGHRGPAFLVTGNFDVIRRYNNSTAYALGVGLLADALAGGEGLHRPWPPSSGPLSRHQISALQSALNRAGFDAGKADGRMGPHTRRALRAFQKQSGLVPDGYVDRGSLTPAMAGLADLGNAAVKERQQAD